MLLMQLDIATLDMFASQTRDLYHIETDREGGYIEFAERQIYRVEHSESYRHENKSALFGADFCFQPQVEKSRLSSYCYQEFIVV